MGRIGPVVAVGCGCGLPSFAGTQVTSSALFVGMSVAVALAAVVAVISLVAALSDPVALLVSPTTTVGVDPEVPFPPPEHTTLALTTTGIPSAARHRSLARQQSTPEHRPSTTALKDISNPVCRTDTPSARAI